MNSSQIKVCCGLIGIHEDYNHSQHQRSIYHPKSKVYVYILDCNDGFLLNGDSLVDSSTKHCTLETRLVLCYFYCILGKILKNFI